MPRFDWTRWLAVNARHEAAPLDLRLAIPSDDLQSQSNVLTIHSQIARLFLHAYTAAVFLRQDQGYGLSLIGPIRHFRQHDSLQIIFRCKFDFIPSIDV